MQVNLDFMGNTTFFDATHPEARKFVWDTVKKNYYDMGIKLFWLDEAEPEYRAYDFDNYRYHAGPVLKWAIATRVTLRRAFTMGSRQTAKPTLLTWYAAPGQAASDSACWRGRVMSTHRSMLFAINSPQD